MLDPWIIEEILRREREERHRENERPRVEYPLESPRYQEGEREPAKPASQDEGGNRGVTVIDI